MVYYCELSYSGLRRHLLQRHVSGISDNSRIANKFSCPPVIKDGPQPDTKVFDDETTYPKFFIDNDLPPLGILPMYQPYANRYEGLDGRRPKSSMPKLSDAEKETKFYMIRVVSCIIPLKGHAFASDIYLSRGVVAWS